MANVELKSSLVAEQAITPGQSGPGEATPSCWSCGTMRAVHFCSSCGKVQPPVPSRLFHVLRISAQAQPGHCRNLKKSSTRLSRRLHPDVFGQADEQ